MQAIKYKYGSELLTMPVIAERTGIKRGSLETMVRKFGKGYDIKKIIDFWAEPLNYWAIYDNDHAGICVCFGTKEEVAKWLNVRPQSLDELRARGQNTHGRLIGGGNYEVQYFSKWDLLDREELR